MYVTNVMNDLYLYVSFGPQPPSSFSPLSSFHALLVSRSTRQDGKTSNFPVDPSIRQPFH